MATKDIMAKLKRETFVMLHLLRKFHPVSTDENLFTEELINKPTKQVLHVLCHFLINIVDTKRAASLTSPFYSENFSEPFYDSSREKSFRSEVSSFSNEYSTPGLLSPIMSSYLVNPTCNKVTLFLFQLTVLAVKKTVETKLEQNSVMEECYKKLSNKDTINEQVKELKNCVNNKYVNYYEKQKRNKNVAQMLEDSVTRMDKVISNAQNYIDNVVDGYLKIHKENDETKKELLKLKDVNETPEVIDKWLLFHDERISVMESDWEIKTKPLFTTSNSLSANTEKLVARNMGEADRSTYVMEYNHKTDKIDTEELQKYVTNEEKYVLMNIEKNGILNFPNLIRSFVIAVGYIFKGLELDEDVARFNQYLAEGNAKCKTVVDDMCSLVKRVHLAEERLEIPERATGSNLQQLLNVPPLPDFSKWTFHKECHRDFVQITPFASRKVFKTHETKLVKPNFKVPITPYLNSSKLSNDEFSKSLKSCCKKTNDPSKNVLKKTIKKRSNETIAGRQTGFSKVQLERIFSSTSKSTLNNRLNKRELIRKQNIADSDNSIILFRSNSSPDLDYGENKSFYNTNRKLSFVPENSLILETSDTATVHKDSGISTLDAYPENATQQYEALSLPTIIISDSNRNDNKSEELSRTEIEFNRELECLINQNYPVTNVSNVETNWSVTPKTNSIEKIIKRYKTFRASMIPVPIKDQISNIDEEIVQNVVKSVSASKCLNQNVRNTQRESLGTILGVDDTFLDQFDLTD